MADRDGVPELSWTGSADQLRAMRSNQLPAALYPVLKGLLFGADGSVWSVVEDVRHERVERLCPGEATLAPEADPLQIASYELQLLSLN